MKHFSTILFFFFLTCGFTGWSQTTTNFFYTGGVQTYTVPAGATRLQVEVNGAQGGGEFGGKGGRVTASIPASPGTVLYVYVGAKPNAQLGPGGFNGGGAVLTRPCGGSDDGWPGGGASDIRLTNQLTDRIIVAGGGGGQGWKKGPGGSGGGDSGTDGNASWISNTNGKAGTSQSGGAGGNYGSAVDSPAPSGSFGQGGNSSPLSTYCTGGGGGGGWYGGGGGYVSAGGGGSGYSSYPGTADVQAYTGINEGHGSVSITVICNGLRSSLSSDTALCQGSLLTLSVSSEAGGSITWNNGVVNGVPFMLVDTGLTTYKASSSDSSDCPLSVNVQVKPSPSVNGGTDIEFCNYGNIDTLLIASGNADVYSWNNGIADSTLFTPATGTTVYILTGTDTLNGCQSIDSVSVTVHEPPVITLSHSDEIHGNDGTVAVTATGEGPFSYDWNTDGTGDLDDSRRLSDLTEGEYTVVVRDQSGCMATGSVTVGSQVSIDDADQAFAVYPNPVTDKLKIELPGNFEFRLIDIQGKIVTSGRGKGEVLLNTLTLNRGIYLLQIYSGDRIFQKRFVKK